MDAKVAAQMCFPFIEKSDLPEKNTQYGKDHLRYMIEEIQKMDCPDKDAKQVRLIPFMSRVIYASTPLERSQHLEALVDEMMKMNKSTEKAMRWVGWLQACLVIGDGATLEDMKNINVKA